MMMFDPFLFLLVDKNITRTVAANGEANMWIKDAVAGAGLIILMVSSFALANSAQAVIALF